MPVVEEYWAGVVRRLQAEVDVFARLVQHHGEQGRENEAALARILEAFVPRRLGVGTGMVIDRFDRYARQADIVLFEQVDEPAVLAQTTQLIYPVESVRASIEVKTRLRSDDIRDCLRKRASLQELQKSQPLGADRWSTNLGTLALGQRRPPLPRPWLLRAASAGEPPPPSESNG